MAGLGRERCRNEGAFIEDGNGDRTIPYGPQCGGRSLWSVDGDREIGFATGLCGWVSL